jgi:hypothetical protein
MLGGFFFFQLLIDITVATVTADTMGEA